MIETIMAHPTVQALGWALLHFIWQGAVVATLSAGIMTLLRHRSANSRYLTAVAAMLLMLALPVVTFFLLSAPSQKPSAEITPLISDENIMLPAPSVSEIASGQQMTSMPALSRPWLEMMYGRIEPVLPSLITIWLLGVLLLSLRLLGGWINAQYIKRRRSRPVDSEWQERLKYLTRKLGISRTVSMVESFLVQVPTVIGWLRPVILLPASALTGLTAEQLEAILAHELAHIRRHDYLINLLQTVIETLLFYHPAVWWVSHRMRVERENSCDDVAVALCGDVLTYARALTELEQLRSNGPQLAVAATGGVLLNRIRRLAGIPSSHSNRFPGLFAGLIVISALVTVATGAHMTIVATEAITPDPATLSQSESSRATREKVEQKIAAAINQKLSSEKTDAQSEEIRTKAELAAANAVKVGMTEAEIATAVETAVQAVLADEKDSDSDENDVENDNETDQEPSPEKQDQKNRIVEAFIGALKDEDANVRAQAASALGSSRDKRAVDPLIAVLNDQSPHVRMQAASSLGDIKDSRAVAPLIAALKDEDANVRMQAASSLGDIRDKSAVEGLMAALKDENANVRMQAASALGDLRDARAADALVLALKDASPNVRLQAASALGDLRDSRAVDGLLIALKDENANVRMQAASALGDLRDARAVEPLITALKDQNPNVRMQAASALGDLRDGRAVDALIAALKDENANVRRQAASALSDIK